MTQDAIWGVVLRENYYTCELKLYFNSKAQYVKYLIEMRVKNEIKVRNQDFWL
jgi:hypothetical protein